MSAAVMTATTPGVLSTSARSIRRIVPARHRRTADGDMQGARRLRHVVDILGRALHVLGGAVVRQRLVHMAQRRFQNGVTRRHRPPSGDRQYASMSRADAGNFGERLDDQIAGDAACDTPRWRADR